MNKTEKLLLIEGEFQKEEAKDILFNLFNNKIIFHQKKNFVSNERQGVDCVTAKKRIPELKKEVDKLHAILSQIQSDNTRIVIKSEIHITISESAEVRTDTENQDKLIVK